jgi:hypothetical protein
MIITKITGGLGNQMFQYAIAKSIAKKREDRFKLDISFYPKQVLRKYELNYFNIEENIYNIKSNTNFIFKIRKKLKFNYFSDYFFEKEIGELDKEVFNYKNNIYLDGYWQNENYFKEIREELLKEFTLKNNISNEAKNYLDTIQESNSISLHIRRGDYLLNDHTNSIHGICDLNYYKKAIKYMNQKIKTPIFYIFSDDIAWCKEKFNFLESKIFVDNTKNAFDDLELMKNCKHNIIANSTFSWWSAWLNENRAKIVVAPKTWWLSRPKKNIVLESWIKL